MDTVVSAQPRVEASAPYGARAQSSETFKVRFGRTGSLGNTQTDSFAFIGRGSIEIDGVWIRIYGRRRRRFWLSEKDQHAFARSNVVNVRRSGKAISFEVTSAQEPHKFVWFRSKTGTAAREIQSLLPQDQTPDFVQAQAELMEFHERLDRLSPIAPVTPILGAINIGLLPVSWTPS